MQRLVEIVSGRYAHASGALWLPHIRTALIADVHLGYAWAQRRRGELAPPVEGNVRDRLLALVDELRPVELAVVGDLVHAPNPVAAEREAIAATLVELAARTRVVLVPGNHDRGFVREFGDLIHVVDEWRSPGYLAVHGHVKPHSPGAHVIIGHLHPCLGVVDDAGAYQKVPVFVAGENGTVLPAFSPFAAGSPLSVSLTPEVRTMLGRRAALVAATGRRAIRIPSRHSAERE